MAITRSGNWLGQQRVDVPDLRSLESAILNDFDLLAGKIIANQQPYIVRAFTINTDNALGTPAQNLVMNVAGGLMLHYGATEAGTLLQVADDRFTEALNSNNNRVSGSFAASSTNYVGIDYSRTADPDTSDITKFLDPNTGSEIARRVPKARVLDYRIVISTSPFSFSTNVCPVAIITTDSSNNIATITDARQLLMRLARGGDSPNAVSGFTWSSREENPNTYSISSTDDPFVGGDKDILSLKDWMASVMQTIWEAKSGNFWYSATTRDGVKLGMGQTVLGNGDNFLWTSGTNTLQWQDLTMSFENGSGAYVNTINDGSAVLLAGQCLYVDIDRTQSANLTAQIANLQSLSTPTIPGSRFIIAWREGPNVYIRDRPFDVERLSAIFSVVIRRYPNVFVSSVVGEGDTTSLATAVTLLPAYGGVLIIQSDLTISSSVTIPANVRVVARRGVTLTLSGTAELILGDRVVIQDWRIASTKTTGVLVRATGFKTKMDNCRIDVAPGGTAIGLQIDGNACSVYTSEFTGVIAPSTGTGIVTAVTAQDFYIAGDNVFAQ